MKKFLLLILLALCFSTHAAQDLYQFETPAQQARFYNLTKDLRCLVCQNQNLAESNAGLANDLRDEIYQKMQTGSSDTQIIQYLVSRYGQFILYKPNFSMTTLILWLAPVLFLLAALGILILNLRKRASGNENSLC